MENTTKKENIQKEILPLKKYTENNPKVIEIEKVAETVTTNVKISYLGNTNKTVDSFDSNISFMQDERSRIRKKIIFYAIGFLGFIIFCFTNTNQGIQSEKTENIYPTVTIAPTSTQISTEVPTGQREEMQKKDSIGAISHAMINVFCKPFLYVIAVAIFLLGIVKLISAIEEGNELEKNNAIEYSIAGVGMFLFTTFFLSPFANMLITFMQL